MSELSLTEYAVLGVLAERPAHGFALARELSRDGDVGRIFTVRRPLVYRALDRLVDNGLAVAAHSERSDSGPNRMIHRVTREGSHRLGEWLDRPVSHVRDIRIEFLLKLALLRRSNTSPSSLVRAQKASLEPTLQALEEPGTDDHVELWRRHTARAVAAYLDELENIHG